MIKGFKIICMNCSEETVFTSRYDGQNGFDGEDIHSSNPERITFFRGNKVIIKCKCGNVIIEY